MFFFICFYSSCFTQVHIVLKYFAYRFIHSTIVELTFLPIAPRSRKSATVRHNAQHDISQFQVSFHSSLKIIDIHNRLQLRDVCVIFRRTLCQYENEQFVDARILESLSRNSLFILLMARITLFIFCGGLNRQPYFKKASSTVDSKLKVNFRNIPLFLDVLDQAL